MGTFMARHVHRKLEEWGEPARVTPTPTRLVKLGLLERVPQERKTPQYLMPHRKEIVAALEALGLVLPNRPRGADH